MPRQGKNHIVGASVDTGITTGAGKQKFKLLQCKRWSNPLSGVLIDPPIGVSHTGLGGPFQSMTEKAASIHYKRTNIGRVSIQRRKPVKPATTSLKTSRSRILSAATAILASTVQTNGRSEYITLRPDSVEQNSVDRSRATTLMTSPSSHQAI
jgi:hypothetical protein